MFVCISPMNNNVASRPYTTHKKKLLKNTLNQASIKLQSINQSIKSAFIVTEVESENSFKSRALYESEVRHG